MRHRALTAIADLTSIRRGVQRRPFLYGSCIAMLAAAVGFALTLLATIDGVLLQPLPFRDPDQLVVLWSARPAQARGREPVSLPDLEDWQRAARTIEAAGAVRVEMVTVEGQLQPVVLPAVVATASVLPTLDLEIPIGRGFLPGDDRPSPVGAVILGRALWTAMFGARPDVIGTTIRIDGNPCVIVGVSRDVDLPESGRPALWLSFGTGTMTRRASGDLDNRAHRFLTVIARVSRGTSIDRVETELQSIAGTLAQEYPDSNKGVTVSVVSLTEQLTGGIRAALLALFASTLLLLLVATVNAANLLMANFVARRREVAVKVAIGGSTAIVRWGIGIEALFIAVAAVGLGWIAAFWAVQGIATFHSAVLPRAANVSIGLSGVLPALALAAVIALLLAAGPLLALSRGVSMSWLTSDARVLGAGRRDGWARGTIVGLQVGASVALAIIAGLLVRSTLAMDRIVLGFSADGLIAVVASPLPGTAADRAALSYLELLHRLAARQPQHQIAATQVLPLRHNNWDTAFKFAEQPPGTRRQITGYVRVAGDYFSTLGVRLLSGRFLTDRDQQGAARSVVVNEAFARRFQTERDLVGARIVIWDEDPPYEIVGIVGDVVQRQLDLTPAPVIYVPYAQHPRGPMTIVVRSDAPAGVAARSVRDMIDASGLPLRVSETIVPASLIERARAPRQRAAVFLACLALCAVLITAFGIYAATSLMVAQRTSEVGVRLALGASEWTAVRLLMVQAFLLNGCGVAAGVLLALGASQWLRGLMYGISERDPAVFIALPVVLTAIAAMAAFWPAQRLRRVKPIEALRVRR
jgi:putative ABC transport system permease protein